MAQQIQLRRGTRAQWTSANPTLAGGELGVETDTTKFKVGNGSTAWNSLAYASLSNQGTWSSATTYYPSDIVQLSGSSYICTSVTTNNQPPNASYWSVLVEAGTVTLSGAQTLTNKTINLANNTLSGTLAEFNTALTGADFASLAGAETLTNKTLTSPVITTPAITDTPYAITDGASVDINPANGFIQTWTLAASRTPVTPSSFNSGQSVLLVITAGANTITWTNINPSWTKQGGSGTAPTLSSSAKTFIILNKVGTIIYASYLGDA